MPESRRTAAIILAAGKGSRMTGYGGNKTLLPLVAGAAAYEGTRPMIVEVLENLPPGPRGIVVHHFAEEVKKTASPYGADFIFQRKTNGTGGALLAACPFVESCGTDAVLITMGDVPLIRPKTYEKLLRKLDEGFDLAVLAFSPKDRAQYGMLEIDGGRVVRVTEWKYWSRYSEAEQQKLRFCNAGVYAAKRAALLEFTAKLAKTPHVVQKQRDGQWAAIEEYFLTDVVELMSAAGRPVGLVKAPEEEVRGVDTPESLKAVQLRYSKM